MKWTAPSQEDLDSWRDNPVTQSIAEVLRLQIKTETELAKRLYWAGKPVSEAERLALIRIEQFCEDVFDEGVTAGDYEAMKEHFDEQLWDQPD